MLKTLIIADDSTGANASAILLKKLNLNTLSLIDHLHSEIVPGYDVIAISTDSRAVNPQEAYTRVSNVLYQTSKSEPLVINKRIDSTLRGNIGSELNAFNEMYPNRKIAIIPSFPNSKRTCINGIVYVDAVRLEDTDAARDPKMPIHTSNAKELFKKQFNGKITNIYINDIKNDNIFVDLINNLYKENDAIIFDSETNKDIETVTEALIKLKIDLICVDPGPFTYYYTKHKMKSLNKANKKYIFLVGSVVDTTFEQLKVAYENTEFEFIALCPNELSKFGSDLNIYKITDQVLKSNKQFICLTSSNPINREILNLSEVGKALCCSAEEVSKIINHNLAKILIDTLKKVPDIGGVFTSGGDVTLGFLSRVSAYGINLLKEVMPLCVYGKIVGGDFEGLPIITKGGMIGNKNTYIDIKEFFEEVEKYE